MAKNLDYSDKNLQLLRRFLFRALISVDRCIRLGQTAPRQSLDLVNSLLRATGALQKCGIKLVPPAQGDEFIVELHWGLTMLYYMIVNGSIMPEQMRDLFTFMIQKRHPNFDANFAKEVAFSAQEISSGEDKRSRSRDQEDAHRKGAIEAAYYAIAKIHAKINKTKMPAPNSVRSWVKKWKDFKKDFYEHQNLGPEDMEGIFVLMTEQYRRELYDKDSVQFHLSSSEDRIKRVRPIFDGDFDFVKQRLKDDFLIEEVLSNEFMNLSRSLSMDSFKSISSIVQKMRQEKNSRSN